MKIKKSLFSPVWKIFFANLIIILSGLTSSCDDDDNHNGKKVSSSQTLLMYMPWSNNLTSFLQVNINDMQKAIAGGILENERVVVFFATSSTKALLFELAYEDGTCVKTTLKEYENHPYTTAEGITAILEDVKSLAPARRYAMTIGSHGMGWIPVKKESRVSTLGTGQEYSGLFHWDYQTDGKPVTRYFGGTSSAYQTDISTLAEGIASAGIVMEYILFDDCYMSCVEVAYELRHACRHLIASTSEMMAYGMPYYEIAGHLLGEINYDGICETFYTFYSNYDTPCGTIAVTRMEEMDSLAAIMKEINGRFTFDESQKNSIQRLDGYTPIIFYDYGDYVSHLCTDSVLLSRFDEQLARTVPYRRHTPYYYSAINNRMTKINRFSGLTTSDPSSHSLTLPKTETLWYKATHDEEAEDSSTEMP